MLKKKAVFEEKTDEELMELYQKGEELAFHIIYQRYVGRIYGYLKGKAGFDRSAQDLTQEVFLKLHRSRGQYNKMLPLAPWVFSISRSVFLDFAKKKSLEDVVAPEDFDHLEANVDSSIELSDESSKSLEALPQTQREVIQLRILDEATFDEIAERLSTSPENVRQILSRGIKKLKRNREGKE